MDTSRPAKPLEIRHLGKIAYAEALALQEQLRDALLDETGADTVLLCEHPDVITFGRSARPEHAPPDEELQRAGYEVFRVNRGGDVTYHGPGQIVGYPILDLARHTPDVGVYLRSLEQVLIETLKDFDITGHRRDGYTGVWVDGRRKIASIGVGVRRWATIHGFALNVSCDLERFKPIIACGLQWAEMTSMEAVVGEPVELDSVFRRVEWHLEKVFG
jgi:lipoate-protein ligase B